MLFFEKSKFFLILQGDGGSLCFMVGRWRICRRGGERPAGGRVWHWVRHLGNGGKQCRIAASGGKWQEIHPRNGQVGI